MKKLFIYGGGIDDNTIGWGAKMREGFIPRGYEIQYVKEAPAYVWYLPYV